MDARVATLFDTTPYRMHKTLMALRELIYTCASSLECNEVEESLKWGQPSYNVKGGSPIRIGFDISIFVY
ncbi:DUF1801 domain-containing protein [Pseudoalteromonas sp. MMG010]|uniref:DUF1801 domain-containing protein n=1 Tax=Pseudoalteromonas sp. MMG010 TaxID=2822685 RepID=UPI001FFCAD1A|nr:DUF1801 domain-containing protein [Pseudoalteromonas sp. MMG010]